MEKTLESIETNYNISSIKVNNKQIWPWLRLEFMYISLDKYKSKIINRSLSKHALGELFLSFPKWFSSYENLFFSSANQRALINEKMYDKSVDYIIDTLGTDKCLTIEMPYPKHFPKKQYYTKNIVSYRVIDAFRFVLTKLSRRNVKVENKSIILKILKDYNLSLRTDLNTLVTRFNIDVSVYSFLLRIYKPKSIFINNAYGKMALVYAANKLGIKTIEVQHGIIGKQHPAYNSKIELDTDFYPSSIFLYGENDKIAIEKSKIYSKTKLFVVGNFFLDESKKSFTKQAEIDDKLAKYNLRVGVTLQLDFELELIEFINKVAIKAPETAFILIPRGDYSNDISKIIFPENVITNVKENFYNSIQYCNIHTTIYSTCALEVPSFNIPNILYNYNDLANLYLKSTLDSNIHKIVNTIDEYINELYKMEKLGKTELDNSANYKSSFKENVKNVIHKRLY